MPGSSSIFDNEIGVFLAKNKGGVFDIGPGTGKMGVLAESAGCKPIECIEAHWPYVLEFGLEAIYSRISVGDAVGLIDNERMFDIVTFGDVIEHMRKSDGVDLLEYLVIRSRWIIVKYPVQTKDSSLHQGESHGNRHERHISIWSEKDFSNFDVDHRQDGPMCLAIIRGYQK